MALLTQKECDVYATPPFFLTQDLKLDFRPLARDSVWYTISIVIMVIVIADGEVHTGESVCLILGYVGYVTFMVFNTTIMGKMCPAKEEDDTEDVELGTQSKAKGMSMDLESIEVEGGERQQGVGDGEEE